MNTSISKSLARFLERARSEPGLGRNLIAILGLVVLGTSFAGYFLAHERFNPPWENKYSVNATFTESPAVSPGNGQEVRIAGVSVGDIRSASVSKRGEAVLKMRIGQKYRVYDNAKVVLRPKSPLNDMYIELNPGGPPGKLLTDGDTLPSSNSVSPIQIDEVLGHLDENAQAAVTSLLSEADVALANAPTDLPKGLRSTDKVLDDLKPVMEQLDLRRTKLAQLVTALSDISKSAGGNDARLARLATSLQRTLGAVADHGTSLDDSLAQLPEFSAKLRSASVSVSALVGQLDPTLDNLLAASDDLPDALSRVDDSVDNLDSFLKVARPVLEESRPVVADLRPAVADLNRLAADLRPISKRLEPITAGLLPYLPDLSAFVYNTNSMASLRDVNRGILRGFVAISPETIPVSLLNDTAAPSSR